MTATKMPTTTRRTWRTWGRTECVEDVPVVTPATPEELATLLAEAPELARFTPLGTGHSFTGIGVPTGTAIDLSEFRGLRRVDPQRREVTVGAGTRLWELPAILAPLGLAMENLGDIDRQTIAGATATGTHGTGRAFGGLATQIAGLSLVAGTGEVLRVDAEHRPDLLPFVRTGLGALGVITEITLRCVPAFALRAEERARPLREVHAHWDELFTGHDHFEFHWFPGTDRAVTKSNTRLPADTPLAPRHAVTKWLNEELVSNSLFHGLCELGRVLPATVVPVNRFATSSMARAEFTEPSARVFAASRRVRFREMEYAVPFEHLREAFDRVRDLVARWPEPIEFPVEVRCAAADEIALSTGFGRDSGYIAVHRYLRKPHEGFFAAVEQVMTSLDGRPHWGKLHTRDREYLQEVYPRFADFLAVRDRLDPRRRFTNPYLTRVLGP